MSACMPSLVAIAHERPSLEAIQGLYAAAPLRRPIRDLERLQRMFEAANVVISATVEGRLVGLLRGWTDFVFDGYICDLAVHPQWQKAGVGRRLLEAAQEKGQDVQWVLLASPLARDYYAHLGWQAVGNGWRLNRTGWIMPSLDDFQAGHADLAARG